MTLLTWRNAYMWEPEKIYDDGILYFRNNAYMWDPTGFYDDLKHSIFKSWFITLLRSLWRHKTSMEQGTLGYSINRYDKSFFVTKFARS
jgi:hypothetical protein